MLLTKFNTGELIIAGDKVGGFGSYRDSLEIYGRARSENKELVIVEG